MVRREERDNTRRTVSHLLEHLNVHSEWERSDLGIPECLTFISVHMGNNCEYTIHSYFL